MVRRGKIRDTEEEEDKIAKCEIIDNNLLLKKGGKLFTTNDQLIPDCLKNVVAKKKN